MTRPTRLVLFDLDDTLFDHQYSRRHGLLALQHAYPLLARIDIEELMTEHERQLTQNYDRVLNGSMSEYASRVERFRRLCAHFGMPLDASAAEPVVHVYRRAYEAHRRSVPGAAPLLTDLKRRVRIGVVTNGLVAMQQEKIRVCHLQHVIDFLLTSEEAGCTKPDRRIFALALAQGQSHPAETVFVGDSWRTDVLGAQQAGIRSVWFNRLHMPCPDARLTAELQAFEPLALALEALGVT